ncbi:hypothetical protein [Symbioplanes lichenis]|uniref:hypothetical protein n=1 Tax=Symbioplanes lichenis TaxID=1629072 RepID=UPI002738CF1F|nr:hypothetical protein [Actinoplanes lichenis]
MLRARETDFRRAPSAHNTQPWTLDYRADEVVIGTDPARALPGSDPTGRDLALGLGAFTEACLIVAADVGLSVACDLGDPHRIRLVAAPARYATTFTAAEVAARRVARGAYTPGVVLPESVPGLDAGLVHLPSRALAADLEVADRWLFGTPASARELREWLRLDPADPRYHQDGLTDRALELNRFEARVLGMALRAYPMMSRLGGPALLAASGRGLLRYDGSVWVLTARGSNSEMGRGIDRERDLRQDGRRLLRVWLTLARHGLAVHPLSQLLDCPATAARLAERVGATPLAVFRVGRPVREPVSSFRLTPSARSLLR